MALKRPTVVAHTLESAPPKSFEEIVIDKLTILETRTRAWDTLVESINKLRLEVKSRPCQVHSENLDDLKKRMTKLEDANIELRAEMKDVKSKLENWIP